MHDHHAGGPYISSEWVTTIMYRLPLLGEWDQSVTQEICGMYLKPNGMQSVYLSPQDAYPVVLAIHRITFVLDDI